MSEQTYPLRRSGLGGYETLDGAFQIERGMDDPSIWCVAATNDAGWKAQGVPDVAPFYESLDEVRRTLWGQWPLGRGPIPKGRNGRTLLRALRCAARSSDEVTKHGVDYRWLASIGRRNCDLILRRELATLTPNHTAMRLTLDGWFALEHLERQESHESSGPLVTCHGKVFRQYPGAYEYWRVGTEPSLGPSVEETEALIAAHPTTGEGEG